MPVEPRGTPRTPQPSIDAWDAALDGLPDPCLLIGRDWCLLAANPAATSLLGRDALRGADMRESLPAGSRDALLPALERALAASIPVEAAWQADDTRFEARALPTSGGVLLLLRADSARRQEPEAALRGSEQLYRTLARHFPNGAVVLFDHDLRYLLADGVGLGMVDMRLEDVQGRTLFETADAEGVHLLEPAFRAALTGETSELLLRFGERSYRLHILPVRDDGGDILAGMLMSQDVTDLLRAEKHLQVEAEITEALYRIGSLVASQLDLDTLARVALQETRRLAGAEWGALFYAAADERGRRRLRRATSGIEPERLDRLPLPKITPLLDAVLRGRRVVRLDDVTTHPRYRPAAAGRDPLVRSLLAVPVVAHDGRALGGLFLTHARPGVFAERDERLAVGIAGQAALAMDNARLYQAARTTERRLRDLLNTAKAIIWESDAGSDRFTFVNQMAEEMLGYPVARWLNEPGFWARIVYPADREAALAACPTRSGKTDDHVVEYRVVTAGGRIVWMRDTVYVVRDDRGAARQLRGVMVDISERKLLEGQLQYRAFHDPTTGLPNRLLLLDRVRQALAGSERTDTPLALLFIDLDNFKIVNDSHGHAAGDELLVQVAVRIEGSVRSGDTASRIGGDEFAILLPSVADASMAVDIARRVLDSLRRPFVVAGQPATVTGSIGIALSRTPHDEAEGLLRRADIAMYRAKEHGKNRYRLADAAEHREALARLASDPNDEAADLPDPPLDQTVRLHWPGRNPPIS